MSLRNLLTIALAILLSGNFCLAQNLAYEKSLSNALTRAYAEGKIVLGDFGRKDCVECIQTKAIWETPAVRGWLQSSAVLWESDVDLSQEWRAYATGLSSIALPFVTWIDPGQPSNRFHYRTGLVGPTQFTQHLTNQALKYLPLLIMNLPGGALSEPSFTISGVARTNALATGSVTNSRIEDIYWRLERPSGSPVSAFQPASDLSRSTDGFVTWSQQVTLKSGSNVFASFVRYANGQTSWTNRVPLIYDGPSVEPPAPARLESTGMDVSEFRFEVKGEAGRQFIVEESADLFTWKPVATNKLEAASMALGMPASPGARFYRVITLAEP